MRAIAFVDSKRNGFGHNLFSVLGQILHNFVACGPLL